MFNRVREVKPLKNYELFVEFMNNEKKIYDVKPLFDEFEPFKAIKSVNGLFEQVRVDVGGYGIIWNDEIDLSCDELYENGVKV